MLSAGHEVVIKKREELDEVQKMIHDLKAAMKSRNEEDLKQALDRNEVIPHTEMEWCAVRDAPRVHTMMTLMMMGRIHP